MDKTKSDALASREDKFPPLVTHQGVRGDG